MGRFTPVAFAAAALLLLDVTGASAQATQWRITPFAGGSVIGELRNSDEGETVEFANSFAVGLSAVFRKGRLGLELQGQFVPTEATSAVGFAPSDLDTTPGQDDIDPIVVAHLDDSNLLFGSLNLLYYTGNSWGENQPFVPREFYFVGGVGMVRFMNVHPARGLLLRTEADEAEFLQRHNVETLDYQGWDKGQTEIMFNLGVGMQFNVLPNLSIQFDLRDNVFRAIERNASILTITETPGSESIPDEVKKTWHNNFVLRQGVTWVLF